LDADGKELYEGPVENYAPPHPDVEGANPETKGQPEGGANDELPSAEGSTDLQKERSAEQEERKAQPASEGNKATAE
jgi:dolichyl-phosphate-mannose-protein mannosyltransferase